MKKHLLLAAAIACVALVGCRSQQYNQVVKETYLHRYGVPCTKDDWEQQGKDGKIVRLRSDGVTVAESYERGVLHGETTYTFSNSSTVHRVETYDHGVLTANRENYPSGVPMKEDCLINGERAKLTSWYEDGTPALGEKYENGYLVSGEYRTPLNVVESRVQNGHGVRICRSSDGELLSKDTVQNGQMVERVTYYPNGDPSTVTPYENGVVHGMRLTFLQGGLPQTVEQWVKGKQEGMTVVYHNGEKISEIPYVAGKREGTESRFRDGSLLVEEVSWENDVQHGVRKLHIDGETKSEWYHQGELVSRTTFERMNMPR